MELPNWNATVFGELQVRRMKEREDRPDVYEARIVHINRENTERLQDWLADLSVGGNTRRYESDHSVINGLKTSRMSGARHSETASVLARMDRRTQPNKADLGSQSDAFGLASQISSVVSGIEEGMSGRQAMSNALKASPKSGGQRRRRRSSDTQSNTQTSSSPRSRWDGAPPTRRQKTAQCRVWADLTVREALPGYKTAQRSAHGKWITCRRPKSQILKGPTEIGMSEQSTKSQERFIHRTVQSRDFGTNPRHRCALPISTVGVFRKPGPNTCNAQDSFYKSQPGSSRHRAAIGVVLPSGLTVKCSAQIVAPMPTGTGLTLRLQPPSCEPLKESHLTSGAWVDLVLAVRPTSQKSPQVRLRTNVSRFIHLRRATLNERSPQQNGIPRFSPYFLSN